MSKVFNKYFKLPGMTNELYDFNEKGRVLSDYMSYMFSRTQRMFEYTGLPDTIPHRILEYYLQVLGYCAFYEHEGELYVFNGELGGKEDVYYMPTQFIIANPHINCHASPIVDKECVVITNDSAYIGLTPLFRRYGTMLLENEISMKMAMVNLRVFNLLSANNEKGKKAAELFLKKIEKGELGAIGEKAFVDDCINVHNMSTSNGALGQLIELEQYIKASWYNEIGLNANYNMKREALNTTESQMNNDALLPLLDDMLKCREIALEKVNKMFGTNISVKLSSSWEDNEIENNLQQELLEAQIEEKEEIEENDIDNSEIEVTATEGEQTTENSCDDTAAQNAEEVAEDKENDTKVDITIDVNIGGENNDCFGSKEDIVISIEEFEETENDDEDSSSAESTKQEDSDDRGEVEEDRGGE